MPIRIVDSEQGSRPAFFCDACGEEIKAAREGNYHWRPGDADALGGTPLYFSHKSACCRAVDRAFKTPCCVGLEGFLFFLAHNLKFDMTKAEAHERMFPGGFF